MSNPRINCVSADFQTLQGLSPKSHVTCFIVVCLFFFKALVFKLYFYLRTVGRQYWTQKTSLVLLAVCYFLKALTLPPRGERIYFIQRLLLVEGEQ